MRTCADIVEPALDLGYSVEKENSCRRLRGNLGSRHVVEIVVPDEVTEWFLAVTERESGTKIFSDWDECYAQGRPTSHEELTSEMIDNVLRALRVLADSEDCRVGTTEGVRFLGRVWFKTQVLEVLMDGRWVAYEDQVYPDED